MRRGRCVGSEPFRAEMFQHIEQQQGKWHYGAEFAESGKAKAERLVAEAWRAAGVSEEQRAKLRRASDGRLVRPVVRGALLGLETGTSKVTLPVVVGRCARTPHTALSGAFLAFRAPDCNGWPHRWVPGGRHNWDTGRICRVPA